jgi:hypothetical protein
LYDRTATPELSRGCRAASIAVIGRSVVTNSLQIELVSKLYQPQSYNTFILFMFLVAGEGHATTSLLAAKSNEFNSLIAKGVRI